MTIFPSACTDFTQCPLSHADAADAIKSVTNDITIDVVDKRAFIPYPLKD
jgi:hypothetical protein